MLLHFWGQFGLKNELRAMGRLMTKRRGQRPKAIPLTVGNDPELWRFNSRHEALEANTTLIAQLILACDGECQSGDVEPGAPRVREVSPVSAAAG